MSDRPNADNPSSLDPLAKWKPPSPEKRQAIGEAFDNYMSIRSFTLENVRRWRTEPDKLLFVSDNDDLIIREVYERNLLQSSRNSSKEEEFTTCAELYLKGNGDSFHPDYIQITQEGQYISVSFNSSDSRSLESSIDEVGLHPIQNTQTLLTYSETGELVSVAILKQKDEHANDPLQTSKGQMSVDIDTLGDLEEPKLLTFEDSENKWTVFVDPREENIAVEGTIKRKSLPPGEAEDRDQAKINSVVGTGEEPVFDRILYFVPKKIDQQKVMNTLFPPKTHLLSDPYDVGAEADHHWSTGVLRKIGITQGQ